MTVEFRGDPRCDARSFERGVAGHLEGSSSTRRVGASLVVGAGPDGVWTAELALDVAGVRSDRRFRGESCAEVTEAAAFVTAIVVDPGVLERSRGALVPTPEPAVEPAPVTTLEGPAPVTTPEGPSPVTTPEGPAPVITIEPPAPVEPVAEPPEPVVRPRRRVGGLLRLAGGFEALGAPRIGPMVAGALGLLGRAWRVELTGMYRAPSRTAGLPGAEVRIWAVGARGCGVLRPGPLEVPLCLGLEAGQARGRGIGLTGPGRAAIPWLAVVVGPALAWSPRRWFALWVGVDLALVVPGERFTAAGGGVLFESARVSLRGALGLELRLL